MEDYKVSLDGKKVITKKIYSNTQTSCQEMPNLDVLKKTFLDACNNGDIKLIQKLIDEGYQDNDNLAISIAISALNFKLISKLLSIKSYPDPEFKINKKNIQFLSNYTSGMVNNVTFSSMFPTTPVMINWHSIGSLMNIEKDWLVNAALTHNPKLKFNNIESALISITRLDLSNNNLLNLPICIFQLTSLKSLNLSQNCLEALPETDTEIYSSMSSALNNSNKIPKSKSFSVNLSNKTSKIGWNLPCLEEFFLNDNKLENLPSCIFELTNLQLLDVSNNKLKILPNNIWFAPKLRDLNLSLNLIKDLPSKMPSIISENQDLKNSSSMLSEMSKFSKSFSDLVFQEEQLNFDSEANLRSQTLKHMNKWNDKIELVSTVYIEDENEKANQSKIVSLNLSHNSFYTIPEILSCAIPNLSRLNLSYNCLKEMNSVKTYPSNLKHLDLSNNQITKWFRTDFNIKNDESYCCFFHTEAQPTNKLINNICIHKEHSKLENLRTLLISNNQLNVLNLYGENEINISDYDQLDFSDTKVKNKLLFPNLSYLDVSCNKIPKIPKEIAQLVNLSVFNISKNTKICQLPAEMGLLSKLWNLNTTDCNLDEPIKSMIKNKKYKTLDIIGYLRSILEDSKPYTRIKLMIVGVQGIGKTTLLDLLRQEGTVGFRHRKPEHWGRRMGNRSIGMKTPKGVSLSTVGVDVSDFTYEKKIRGKQTYGPVTFRTWDFGGQKEYYATHQYFLSRRSLYLIVWKIIDGEKGVETIHKWLVNIQARAPNSPVIIIGTFHDQIEEFLPKNFSEDLQKIIRERFINILDPDKVGLPKVIDSIEVSTKTKYNIKNLCNLIYDTVFDIRCPGSKERLLMQKIPASYLALEDMVGYLAAERKAQSKDPVLKVEEYKTLVTEVMQSKYGKTFRDLTELNQATSFLHDNGVLLHYEDATLKDLYFLDPQWLCDLLAHVVTIREINPYSKNGTMKTEDLKLLFKSTVCSFNIKSYILNLLNKFEVALTWDSRTILIPSLLPSEELLSTNSKSREVRIPLKTKSRTTNYFQNKKMIKFFNLNKSISIQNEFEDLTLDLNPFIVKNIKDENLSIHRLFLMSYFPCGFWSRLIVKLLADDIYSEILKNYFTLPDELLDDKDFITFLNKNSEWRCWQTGLSLVYLNQEVFRVKEILNSVYAKSTDFDYYQNVKFYLKQEKNWVDINIQKTSILEIYLPNESKEIKETKTNKVFQLKPNFEFLTKLLAVTVDHIDILLEDWYPSLGTRFVHTSDGKFLVTRVVPCIKCMNKDFDQDSIFKKTSERLVSSTSFNAIKNNIFDKNQHNRNIVYDFKRQPYNTISNFDKPTLKHLHQNYSLPKDENLFRMSDDLKIYCFMVEDCILKASEDKKIFCPIHKSLNLNCVAPDTMFCDLPKNFVFSSNSIKRAKLLGKGAFGFVFKATVETDNPKKGSQEVAMKTLQPVEPGTGAKNSDNAIYKASLSKWERDPLQYSSKAYCTARQELNILLQLNHNNIVQLLGVCLKPLALILKLAPLGALDLILKDYRRSGMQLEYGVLQSTILQVARALEYLHQNHIIYRDLKSENVLVWDFPTTHSTKKKSLCMNVDIKLADYGISRSTLPTGTKGFGGTEGFMAPEIYQYNGEEEYTEKVDCFSFGMFIFELISLRLPFEGQESVKDHILEGLRPKLTQRDILYPSYVLDLMVQCWSQSPNDRPATSHIVSIVSAPEFIHMLDAISLADNYAILCSDIFCRNDFYETWIGRLGKQTDLLFCDSNKWQNYKTIGNLDHLTVMSICVIPESGIWIGDSKATIHIFSLDGSYIEIINFCLDVNALTAVKCIKYIECLDLVVILSTSGRLWLCERETLVTVEIMNKSLPYLCFSIINSIMEDEFFCQIWCGQPEGEITIISLKSMKSNKKEFINHYQCEKSVPILERFDVFEIVSENQYAWTYLYPGSVVYQWDSISKTIMQKLDCSKLAPCSESLMSISIEQHLCPSKCQIKSMTIMDDELYIGTTLGSLIIVEASKMRPITVFRPFEEEIRLIIPVNTKKIVHHSNNFNNLESSDIQKFITKNKKFIITIGKGFRDLLDRYLKPLHDSNSTLATNPGLYAVLWSSDNWLS